MTTDNRLRTQTSWPRRIRMYSVFFLNVASLCVAAYSKIYLSPDSIDELLIIGSVRAARGLQTPHSFWYPRSMSACLAVVIVRCVRLNVLGFIGIVLYIEINVQIRLCRFWGIGGCLI